MYTLKIQNVTATILFKSSVLSNQNVKRKTKIFILKDVRKTILNKRIGTISIPMYL